MTCMLDFACPTHTINPYLEIQNHEICMFAAIWYYYSSGMTFLHIALLTGHVYAAGAFFALVQDFRVMRTERGWFCLPEVNIKRRFTVGMYEILK